jgi:DNA-binding NarL/FixJ family response regulator
MAMQQCKRIFIVDDQPVFREGLQHLINREADLAVCGEADEARAALAEIERVKPDLVLVDIGLPGRTGLELIKDLRVIHPELALLVVSMQDELLYAERVLRAGGRGYITKHAGAQELMKAIRRVLDGHLYVSDAISEMALKSLPGRRSRASGAVLDELTDREFEVFQLLGQGLTTREIGERLHMSGKTVETHRLHIRAKLDLRSGPELIKVAVRWVGTQALF